MWRVRFPVFRVALLAVAALLPVLAYFNALPNPFVYDDHFNIIDNPSIRHLGNVWAVLFGNMSRPLVNVTYALDFSVWGLNPFGYHLTNLALHIANVLLVFCLTLRLAGDRLSRPEVPGTPQQPSASAASQGPTRSHGETGAQPAASPAAAAFVAAALLAVHPLMTEAVGYISGRPEPLCALFFLLSLILLRAWWTGGSRRWLVAGMVSWALALASKETAAMLPFVLVAYDRLLVKGRNDDVHRRLSRLPVPLVATVAALGLVRLAMLLVFEHGTAAAFVARNLLVYLDVIRRYVSLLVVPTHQAIFHGERAVRTLFDKPSLLNFAWLVALSILAFKLRRREPLATFGMAWFLLLLVPAGILLAFDIGEPMAEHRAYLASIGVFLAVGMGYAHVLAWPFRLRLAGRTLALGAALLFILASTSWTLARNLVWSDPVQLWQEAVAESPDLWVPYRGLGDALRERGDCEGAITAYQTALRSGSADDGTYLSLATCLIQVGRLGEADQALSRAFRSGHASPFLLPRTPLTAEERGAVDAARDRLRREIAERPRDVEARRALAFLSELFYSDFGEALRLCREVKAIDPGAEHIDDCISRTEMRLKQAGAGR